MAVSLRACCTPPPLHCFQEKLKVASKDKNAGGLGPLEGMASGTKASVPHGFPITSQILPQSYYLLIKIRKGRRDG